MYHSEETAFYYLRRDHCFISCIDHSNIGEEKGCFMDEGIWAKGLNVAGGEGRKKS